jgi:hypothetical protein
MPAGIKFIPSLINGTSSVGVGLSSIVGPTGPAGAFGGPQGYSGLQGNQGINGTQGNIGYQGLIGPTGIIGTQGSQGIVGTQGSQGIIGTQGSQGIVGMGFTVFASVNSYSDLNTVMATGGNIGQFVLILGGDLFVYSGTGAG